MNAEGNDKIKTWLCVNAHAFNGKHIPSPSEQPRRGAVAAILRWRTSYTVVENKAKTIEEFFQQDWVINDPKGQAEILFMQRATRVGDRWSGHVAFPGGKNEELETDEETCKREVLEEIGLDLNSDDFIQVGKLDEREVFSVATKKLLMMLIPFVYLQVAPETPPFKLQESEVAAVQCE
ncbi:hypothetical protein K501DRAFT_291796 [Backusella circina FSU 941]|nr:hypothetical protein K501DRAFT_291796 [Backusella circina FSU 941]